MATGAIRGSRIGAGPMGEDERGQVAPRMAVQYFCRNGHTSVIQLSIDAEAPAEWDCQRCGLPAGQNPKELLAAPTTTPFKTHLAYVKERRSETEAKAILDEALKALRERRSH